MKIYEVIADSADGIPNIRIDSDAFKAYPALDRAEQVIVASGAKKNFDDYLEALRPGMFAMYTSTLPVIAGMSRVASTVSVAYSNSRIQETPQAIYKALWKDFQAFAKEYEKGAIPIQRSEVASRFPVSTGIGMGFYTAHPMADDRLVPVEDFHAALKDEKDSELIDLMRVMGATSISIIDRVTNEFGASAGGSESESGVGATVGGGSKSGTESMTKVTMSGHDEPVPDDLMEKSIWFRNDPRVLSIFKGRRHGNRIHSFALQSTYSQSFGFDFDMALKVTKIDLKAKFEKIRRVERTFEVSFS